jgi:hypothetical protein
MMPTWHRRWAALAGLGAAERGDIFFAAANPSVEISTGIGTIANRRPGIRVVSRAARNCGPGEKTRPVTETGKPGMLCFGHDALLNRTRRLIFEQYFDVTVADQLSEAAALLPEGRFALVVLCYSLRDEECRAMVERVHRESPETNILILAEGRERLELRAGDAAYLSRGPAELLRKAASMAGVPVDPAKQTGGSGS